MKYLKMFGMAAIAAMALMAFAGAGSASAFTSAHCAKNGVVLPHCLLDAHSVESANFATTAGTITCTTTTGDATIEGTVTSIETTKIEYSGCTFLGFIGVKVEMGTCQYKFTFGAEDTGTVDITPSPCTIKFTAGTCTVSVNNQNGLSSVTYENMAGPPKDVTVIPNVTNIVYSTTSGCPNGAKTNEKGGKYTGGKITVTGTSPAGTLVDFTVA
jgi:hypothetical protein